MGVDGRSAAGERLADPRASEVCARLEIILSEKTYCRHGFLLGFAQVFFGNDAGGPLVVRNRPPAEIVKGAYL